MTTNGIISESILKPIRLSEVVGFEDRKNDVVYGKPLVGSSEARVVLFFPGDVQDYTENMEAHRDNKHHKQWNLEGTATILQNKFPQNHVLVIKPSRMDYKTFSCFQNFVKSSQLGVPDHTPDYNALRHLNGLVKHVSERLRASNESGSESGLSSSSGTISSSSCDETNLENRSLEIIGFSKGCVVLNQLLYEFHNFKTLEKDEEVLNIISKIKDMYWLDGGHSGGKKTWINEKEVLGTLCSLGINVHVHVSPYQIQDDRRPWIKKEENMFSDYLLKHGCHIERKVHFESVPPSIITHFDVINTFKK